MKVRIIERTNPDGKVQYVIQQKHLLFRWWWVDACMNAFDYINCKDYFNSLEEAQKSLCYFDGSECKEKVVHNG